ncbi:MAG: dUTP diphosphatase [Candidatus Pacebacteria bacterium]|nr:dUTP diphosphatase [Candidatus Paceibacterota bacterium]
MRLKVKKLFPEARVPHYARKGDAGLELYAREKVTLLPGERASIPTGIAIEIPEGYVSLIWDKSGISHNYGIKTLGGVIDFGYRGEYKVGVVNLSKEAYTFEKHHKVAQLLIQKIECVEVEETKELSESERGLQGFGSSGK